MPPIRSRVLRPDWILAAMLVLASLLVLPSHTAQAAGPSDRSDINQEDQNEKTSDRARARSNGDVSPDRLVVVYASESAVDDSTRARARQESGGKLLTASSPLRRDIIRVQNGDAAQVAVRLRSLPGVVAAYPDQIAHKSAESTPWGVTKIGGPTAWPTSTGAGVTVAVLDCGIHKTHEDIGAARVTLEIDYTGSAYGADDRCNHGTHVAGTIGATTNNGIGVSAVAPGVTFINGKVMDDSGSGFFSDIESGIAWAANNGAKVINMSLGAFIACPASTAAATNYAWSKGVVIVAAAGNDGQNGESAPANCPNVIGVAATDSLDQKASFSNYGKNVELAGPGVGILSTVNPDINAGVLYASFNGTSMAAPHAAGVAAAVWASSHGTSATAVRQRMYDTADKIAGTGANWQYGRLNMAAAVRPISPDFSLAASPASVTINAGASATSSVTVTRIDGLADVVTLTPTAPSGLTVTPASSTSSPVTFTIGSTLSTLAGNYTVTVTGVSGVLSHVVTIAVTVSTVSTVPGAPVLGTPTEGNRTVTVNWAAPSNGGSPITGYRIYRGRTSGGETLLTTVGNVASYRDSQLTNGSTYYYRVAAVNAVGTGLQSNEVSATPHR